jgi:hypothetical protein
LQLHGFGQQQQPPLFAEFGAMIRRSGNDTRKAIKRYWRLFAGLGRINRTLGIEKTDNR